MCFCRIDAAGDEGRGDLANGVRQLGRILPHRDRVQIDDAIDAVVAVLQFDEALDGAEIIAEMQVAGRLHAGKNQFLETPCTVSAANERRDACGLPMPPPLAGVPMPWRRLALQGPAVIVRLPPRDLEPKTHDSHDQ
jgi:hypothetical protein